MTSKAKDALKILFSLSLIGLVGCSMESSFDFNPPSTFSQCPLQKENHNEAEEARPTDKITTFTQYQIGDQWDRSSLEESTSFAHQVVQLYHTGFGAVGTGVYLGEFAGQHLVLTAKHVYQYMNSCRDEVNFLFNNQGVQFYAFCTGWSYRFNDNDLMLFAIDTADKNHFKALKKLTFDSEHRKNEPLKLISIEQAGAKFNFNWFIDESKDCQILSSQIKKIKDPDCKADDNESISSYSLPIGCDGKHGDSGAPIYSIDNKLKGILWTGRFPKDEITSKKLFEDSKNQSPPLWQNYNYMVPISAMENEIDTVLQISDSQTQEILKALSQKIKADQN